MELLDELAKSGVNYNHEVIAGRKLDNGKLVWLEKLMMDYIM
ncbi:hypothetical protein [Salipaludibacillus sp. LMS25]|jgi:hypothetical protein|nr:hypothetical protein [Salipaludibacillus sp. LMS25]